jgi:type IX secretion system PorP/SprF family membrane protein
MAFRCSFSFFSKNFHNREATGVTPPRLLQGNTNTTHMKNGYSLLLAAGLFCLPLIPLKAQDPEFSQFYANSLYLNPALAGSKICPNIQTNYRQQWPGIAGTYSTFAASYDQYAYKVKGGIGVTVVHDQAGQGTLNTTGVGVVYAPVIPLGRNASISVGFQAGWWQKAVNWSMLNFGDQIDPRNGFILTTQETPGQVRVNSFDLGAGAMFSSRTFYAGVATHHILEQNESLLNGNSPLPRKYTVHAGGIIRIGNSKQDDRYISPNIMYRQQQDFRRLDLGMYVKNNSLVGGLWYRGRDAFIMLIGLDLENGMRVGYSYDVTVSRLTNASAGAHEVSLGWMFKCKKPTRKYRLHVCPSF